MIKLIVTDVDGTLVKDGTNDLNKEYYDVITKLMRQGIIFTAASGRQYHSIRKVFAPIADHIHYISEGGAVMIKENQVIHAETFSKELVRELLEDTKKLNDCDAMISGKLKAYCPHADTKMYRWMVEDYGFDIIALGGWDQLPPEDVVKFSVYHPSDAEGATSDWFVPKWSQRLKISCAGHWWMDCVKKGVHKGSAVKQLQEMYQIKPQETMVFGDNINDIEMMQCGAYSYAVENAREEVKQEARYIAASYQYDGVLQELKKLLV